MQVFLMLLGIVLWSFFLNNLGVIGNNNYLTVLTSALLVVLVAYKVIKRLLKANLVVIPSLRSSHTTPTPTAGGVAIIAAFFIGIIALIILKISTIQNDASGWIKNLNDSLWANFLIASIILAIVSFWDDYKEISYKIRLVTHFLCAIILLLPFKGGFFDGLLMVLITVAIINSANFIDGLNGLLSGCWLIGIPFSLFGLLCFKMFFLPFLFIYLGTLVFFFFNFPKGKIFLGDVGSTFLGLTIALLANFANNLTLQQNYVCEYKDFNFVTFSGGVKIINNLPQIFVIFFNNKWLLIITLLPFSFLWFDVFLTLIRRIIHKKKLTNPYRDYPFHLLNDLGLSHTKISCIYFALTFFMGCLALANCLALISFSQVFVTYAIIQTLYSSLVFFSARKIISAQRN